MKQAVGVLLLVGFLVGYCQAQSKPWVTVLSEEVDSSEYGLAPGRVKTNCTCGWTNKEKGRIVGGIKAGMNEYPYMAGLVRIREGRKNFLYCGSTIVTEYHAITAAHCTVDETVQLGIVVGEHDLSTEYESAYTKTYLVKDTIHYGEYNPDTYKHDIAILVTWRRIQFNQVVGPACLPDRPLYLEDKYVKVTGWGDLQFEGSQPTILQKVFLRVIRLKDCKTKFTDINTYSPTQFCTFGWKKDSCQGDSGGPVTWLDPDTNRYILAGVVSFGIGCATTNPGVNTDVYAYIDWIQHHIHRTTPGRVSTCAKMNN